MKFATTERKKENQSQPKEGENHHPHLSKKPKGEPSTPPPLGGNDPPPRGETPTQTPLIKERPTTEKRAGGGGGKQLLIRNKGPSTSHPRKGRPNASIQNEKGETCSTASKDIQRSTHGSRRRQEKTLPPLKTVRKSSTFQPPTRAKKSRT